MREISGIISFLVILHPVQGSWNVKSRFWQYTHQQKPDLVNSQSRSLFLEMDPQTNQEVMSQRYQQHMMMPSQPTAHLIMIKADFTFGFFKDSFDRPTHAADTYELGQGCISRSITEIVLDDRRIIQITADNQPNLWLWQIPARLAQSQESEVTHDGSFAAFFDSGPGPALFRNACHQFPHQNRTITRMAQTQPGWTTAATFPLRDMHFGSDSPNWGSAFDLSEIPFPHGRNPISKSRRIPVQLIRSNPLKGQMTALYRFLQQFQANFWLGLVNQIFRHTTSLAFFANWLHQTTHLA